MYKYVRVLCGASVLALTSLLIVAPKSTSAATISYTFNAEVTGLAGSIVPTLVSIGDAVSGAFSYTYPENSIISDNGLLAIYDVDAVLSYTVNGSVGGGTDGNLRVQNGLLSDRIAPVWGNGTFAGTNTIVTEIFFLGLTSFLSDNDLPTTLGLAGWTSVVLNMFVTNDELFVATLTSLTQTSGVPLPIPVPAALPLFLSGLIGLGVMARRRKQKVAAA